MTHNRGSSVVIATTPAYYPPDMLNTTETRANNTRIACSAQPGWRAARIGLFSFISSSENFENSCLGRMIIVIESKNLINGLLKRFALNLDCIKTTHLRNRQRWKEVEQLERCSNSKLPRPDGWRSDSLERILGNRLYPRLWPSGPNKRTDQNHWMTRSPGII